MVNNEDKLKGSKLNTPMLVLMGVILLQVGVLAATVILVSKSSSGSEISGSRFPIWFIPILIPLLASRKKNYSAGQKKMMMWMLAGLGTLVLIVMMMFLLELVN